MKNQNKIKLNHTFVIGLLSLPMLTGTSFANSEGSGVRGGGNTQDVNGTPRLLDLVTQAKCMDDKTGDEIMESEKGIKPILNQLAKLDWYFAADLENEIRSMHFCYTGKLKFLPPVDVDAPILQREIPEYKSIRQLGIRVNKTVYIDQERLNTVPAFDRAMFFIHEATHAFISMEDPMRKLDLYTIVAAIADAGSARVPTREKLHYIFSQHNLEFPQTVSELDPFQQQVEYAISGYDKRRAMILNEQNPEILINTDASFLNSRLAYWHVINTPLKQRMAYDIATILVDGTITETARIMNEQKYSEVKVAQAALSVLPKLSKEKQKILFDSNRFVSLGNDTYAWIASLVPVYSEFRIRANPDLQSLGAGQVKVDAVPLMDVDARKDDRDQEALPQALKALANITVLLIKNEKWDQVKTLVTENPGFYNSFSLQAQLSAVDQLNPKFSGEKESAKKVLVMMASGLKSRWMATIQGQITAPQFKTFQTMIKK